MASLFIIQEFQLQKGSWFDVEHSKIDVFLIKSYTMDLETQVLCFENWHSNIHSIKSILEYFN